MGKALIIPNVSFATDNLGQITFADGQLRSITIVGSDSISGVSTYTVSYYPQNTEYTGVEWTVLSGNATIGRDTGVLTPSTDGTVVIQAQSTHDRSIVATKTISVSIVVPLTSISIYGSDSIDGASTYSVIYNPQNTTQTGVTWSVLSGPATITQAGLLTPSDNGTVVIKATSTYNAQVVTTKTITVSMEIPVTSISIVGDSLISGQSTYSIAYNPSNTTQQGVTWSVVSGNATITQQGVLTSSDNGEVVIQAVSTYNSQVVATKTVTVSMVIPLVSMLVVGDDVIEGETTYSVTYNPSNTTETGVTWEVVSGPATITQGGVLTPSADGEIIIRATSTENQSITATKTVTMDSSHHFERDYFTIESLEDGNEIKLRNFQSLKYPTINYSTDDGETWSSATSVRDTTVPVATINTGDKMLIKCEISNWANSYSAYNALSATKQFKVYGNAMSLLYGDNFADKVSLNADYTLLCLLRDNTTLVDISNLVLPATTLRNGCYYRMFYGCTGLTSIPANLLPATTLTELCYKGMFYGCTGLTTVPYNLLPATTLRNGCYEEMFYGCTGMITIPQNLLPATRLMGSCYRSMFDRCSSLTNVPNLPAMTLANDCYRGMFNMCVSLTSVPANLLPATTLAEGCYRYMFGDCENLVEAPILPAPTLAVSCYQLMFTCDNAIKNQNFKLASITCLATDISATDALTSWVFWDNAQSSVANGTFKKAAGVTWPTGISGIPTGWTVEDYVEPSNNE